MSRRNVCWALAAALVGAFCWVGTAVSQQTGQPGADRRDRRRQTSEEMRKRFEEFQRRGQERMREQLGINEEEWKVLMPRIEKVQQLQQQGRGMRFARPSGRRGRRADRRPERRPEGEAERQLPDVEKKAEALQNLLKDKASGAEAIKAALGALRKAREKAEKDLATARKELRDVVTVRQEAQLVLLGILN